MKPLAPHSRILVYTDGEIIGDGILRLPFAAALKQAMPGLHLTWLASGYSVYATDLREMAAPLIDELLIIPDRRMYWRDFIYGPAPTRDKTFDLIIDAQRNTKRTLWLKRIPHTRFMSAAADYWLCRPFIGLRRKNMNFFAMLMKLGEVGTGHSLTAPALALPPGDWREQARALLPDGPSYVGFAIGAGYHTKCWPLERFIALAQQVAARGYVPVMFVGPKEQQHADAIRVALPTAILPLNSASGGTPSSPYLTIALAERLKAAVANDSGGGHLLAAGGVPMVSLFRLATVRTKFLPRTSLVTALAPEDFSGTAIADIPLTAAQDALERLLEVSAPAAP